VYFVHEGPAIVIDSARGKGQAAIAWHLVGEGRRDNNGLWLRGAPSPVWMILPPQAWQSTSVRPTGTLLQDGDIGAPNWDVVYRSPVPGQLDLATMFASGPWASVQYEMTNLSGGQIIKLTGRGESLTLLQNDVGRWLQAQGLATDGRWALMLQQNQDRWVCSDGGTRTQVSAEDRPAQLRDAAGGAWPDWEWDSGILTILNTTPDETVCLNVLGRADPKGF